MLRKERLNRKMWKAFINKLLGFSIVGVLMTLLSMLLIWVCNDLLYINMYVAYVVIYGVTIILSCVLNAHYVWKHRLVWFDIAKYFIIYLSSMLLGVGIIYLLEWLFPTANHTLLSYCSLPFTYAWNYIFVNHIFRNTNEE